MGIEPTTSSLGSWHSTAELRPPESRFSLLKYIGEQSGSQDNWRPMEADTALDIGFQRFYEAEISLRR
jgi:hypothetical protein